MKKDNSTDLLQKSKKSSKTTAKKPHNSTKLAKPTIKTHQEEYHSSMFSLRVTPTNKDYLLKMALEWVDWAMNCDDALTLKQYFILKRVQSSTVDQWISKVPELGEAKELVREIIATRREIGMLQRKYPETAILKTMPMYDKDWRDLEEWRAGLAAKIQAAGNKQWDIIEVPIVEDCPEVPKRLGDGLGKV